MPNPRSPASRPHNRKATAAAVAAACLAAIIFVVAACLRLAGGPAKAPAPQIAELLIPSVRGANIHATATLPADGSNPALVVLCHGFTGNRQGDGHFAPLAMALASQGVAAIALDFAGNGESEEDFTAYTLESIYDDIDTAIAYMEETYQTDPARVGLVGHSMGGRAVTLHLSENIAAAALWSPANGDGLDGLEFLDHDPAGREAIRTAAAEAGSYPLPGWNVAISTAFVEQMADSHPLDALAGYSGALLVAFAGGDTELLSQGTIDATLQAAAGRAQPFTDLSAGFAAATHNYAALSGDEAEGAALAQSLESQTASFLLDALAD
ncbi:MAG: alpha/beta fold hydrolase [Gemmiger sp.]|nr:alpha/beta fold hydrolase [Gemmiger sp.]